MNIELKIRRNQFGPIHHDCSSMDRLCLVLSVLFASAAPEG